MRDNSMHWKLERKFFGVQLMNMIGASGASAGAEGGAPILAVASGASSMAVVQIAAAADEVEIAFPLPWNLNREKKVLGRIWFLHASTGTDTPDWLVTSKFSAKQATVTATDTSADATCAFAAKACSANDDSLEVTNWGDLGWAGKLTKSDLLAQILLECNGLGSASANEIELIGFEIMYEIEATAIHREQSAAKLLENPL